MNQALIVPSALTVLGCLSPLLTFTALFQQKEWRADRLIEHLYREGFFRQLFGRLRPLLAALMLMTDVAALYVALPWVREAWLWVFAGLTAMQFLMRKQRRPVWTAKATLIIGIALLVTASLTVVMPSFLFTPFLLLAQPFIVTAVWTILLPVDSMLKRSVFHRARDARNTWDNATVIGIAGSVGKTTTKELLRCVLQDLDPLVTPEHVNTEMGVAKWLLQHYKRQTTNDKLFIVEMGAYRKGEIELMCSFVQPTIGVVTALGSDHLALFGSEEAIVDANAELLESLPEHGHAFLYADNDASRNLENICSCEVTMAGIHEKADVRAGHVEQTNEGLKLTVGSVVFDVAIHGLHNAGNILLAIAVARHLGIPDERIRETLKHFQAFHHTFHVHRRDRVLVVDDTYNSSRLSIRAGLHWASQRPERPRILLLSELLETGSQEKHFLEELGALAAASMERVILIDPNMRPGFEKGYGRGAEVMKKGTMGVDAGSLLLCIGRMPQSIIEQLLPM